ncbi:MAG: hypothetical protein II135_09440 [Clostridia bacterium]|nr:hypothetical protein [Clostridia bacterium]MBQ3870936.1 hypothetical protein [Clostridia bacterium]
MILVLIAVLISSLCVYAAAAKRCGTDPVFTAPAHRILYVFLSLTWGLPMTLAGAFAALILLISGHRPKRFYGAVLFELPKIRFGLSLGLFIISPEGDLAVAAHEYGHGIQNICLGPFMIPCVAIPSALRYHYRNIRTKLKKPCKTAYDGIWFERSATESGVSYVNSMKNKGEKR